MTGTVPLSSRRRGKTLRTRAAAADTPALRAGDDDLRFKLPKSFLSTLRRSSAAKNVLTLTPVAASGAAGRAITRRVELARK